MNHNKNKKPRAVLVDLIDPQASEIEERKRLEELESLVSTFGGIVIVTKIQRRGTPDYRTFIGKGKAEEIREIIDSEKVDMVILNNLLKAGQIYNLQELFRKDNDREVQVWDRVDLILKIFEKHAKSTEAKLQIELASIRHFGPRIYGMGTELSRQEGAVGVRSGQGESNIELMKRHLQRQELKIVERLKHYEVIREGHRKRRRRQNLKTVALVGYTNAGKSSLLKALTGKQVYIANELFATLDTRVGDLYLPESQRQVLISDTIGFIQDLPPELIEAFKSTLAETVEADLLLHVIDVSDPHIRTKISVVEDILKQLGLEDRPKIYVFNKTDLVRFVEAVESDTPKKRPPGLLLAGKETSKLLGWHSVDDKLEAERGRGKPKINPRILKNRYKKFKPQFVSVMDREGLEELRNLIDKSV